MHIKKRLYKRRIRKRFICLLFLLIAGNSLLISHVVTGVVWRNLDLELTKRLRLVSQRVALSINSDLLGMLKKGDERSEFYLKTRELLKKIKEEEGLVRLSIIDKNRNCLVDTEEPLIGGRFIPLELADDEIKSVIKGVPLSSILYRTKDGSLHKSDYLPLRNKVNETVGIIRVEAGSQALGVVDEMRKKVFYIGIFSLVIAFGIAVYFSRRMVKPIEELTNVAESIKEGDLSRRAEIKTQDEVGFLALTINHMVDSIQAKHKDEKKRLEERLKDLQVLSYGIAHEIRNPLAAISGLAELLQREIRDIASQDTLDLVTRIQKEVNRLNVFVTDFLSYAKKPILKLEKVDLNRLIEVVISQIDRTSKKIFFHSSFQSNLPLITGDREKLSVVFKNLFSNALDAIGDEGVITITTKRKDEGLVEISIQDNGCGIPEEVKDKIFNPFFTTKEKGVGLGLSIVHNLIEAHGGKISFRSGDSGTTFFIELPIRG